MSARHGTRPPPVMLVILDGWGWREERADNAVLQARTPAFDRLWASAPHAFLSASGVDVGLPSGQMGNSEVGHLNIGAGRIVEQELPRIDRTIAEGSLIRAPALVALGSALRQTGGACHLLGLVSPGGVHSHQDHALALARLLAQARIKPIIHIFLDGRDTGPFASATHLPPFLAALPESVAIGSISGRYYAMDRDQRWDRAERAYRAIAEAEAPRFPHAMAAVGAAHSAGTGDEFVPPAVVGDYGGMRDGDGLLSFNFRADRVRQLLAALLDPSFQGFPRPRLVRFAAAAGMTDYGHALAPFLAVIFSPTLLTNILGEVVSAAGLAQLHMAETEKYAHVTYFLNGGREEPFASEDRILVHSPKVATYDLQPEMSAPELTNKALAVIEKGRYDLIVLNFANPDMVGHTGKLAAAIRAVETVDEGLGQIAGAIERAGGALIVTADHGNCELMRDPATGGPHTAHTTNPVPVLLAGTRAAGLRSGRLADIAPTLLALLGLPKPPDMTGQSLIADAERARS
ncbi:MAG: 2,3-bisphosphoglycerate-independent phosphoglycerate mutase [Acetobacteraceae bacterium]